MGGTLCIHTIPSVHREQANERTEERTNRECVALFVFVNLLLALSNRIDYAIRIHISF